LVLQDKADWLKEILKQPSEIQFSISNLEPNVSKIVNDVRNVVAQGMNKEIPQFTTLIQTWPILPQPIISSKLFVACSPNGIAPAVSNSFDILKAAVLFELECEKRSKVKDRKLLIKKKSAIADVVLQRIFWTYADVITVNENDRRDLFVGENMMNCMNLIRILEYTALDLLGIPKANQEIWGTPEVPLEDFFMTPSLIQSLQESLGVVTQLKLTKFPSKELEEKNQKSVLDYHGYTTNTAIDITLWWSKSMLKTEVKWRCGNWKTCENEEVSMNGFKLCASCHWVRYCSRPCQITDWKDGHKEKCGKEQDKKNFAKQRLVIRADEN